MWSRAPRSGFVVSLLGALAHTTPSIHRRVELSSRARYDATTAPIGGAARDCVWSRRDLCDVWCVCVSPCVCAHIPHADNISRGMRGFRSRCGCAHRAARQPHSLSPSRTALLRVASTSLAARLPLESPVEAIGKETCLTPPSCCCHAPAERPPRPPALLERPRCPRAASPPHAPLPPRRALEELLQQPLLQPQPCASAR